MVRTWPVIHSETLARQPGDERDDVGRDSEPADRGTPGPGVEGLLGDPGPQQIGVDQAAGDGVDGDGLAGDFHRQVHDQRLQRRFGRADGGVALDVAVGEWRRDTDEAALLPDGGGESLSEPQERRGIGAHRRHHASSVAAMRPDEVGLDGGEDHHVQAAGLLDDPVDEVVNAPAFRN